MKSNGKAHVRVTCDDTCGIYPPISRIVGFLALPELPISRLTLRLPVTLHRQLEKLAKREQTSLNQYLVYVLARQAIEAYTVHELPEEAVTQQRTAFPTLLQNLGHASSDQIEKVMMQREETTSEKGLSQKIVSRLRRRLASQPRIVAERRGKAQTHV